MLPFMTAIEEQGEDLWLIWIIEINIILTVLIIMLIV